jgi:hypothetical protein
VGPGEVKPSVKIGKDIPLSEPATGYMNLPFSPFDSFDYDGDIGWKLFRTAEKEKFLNKYYGWIGDVPVSVYTRGELKSDEPTLPPQTEEIPKEEGESETDG